MLSAFLALKQQNASTVITSMLNIASMIVLRSDIKKTVKESEIIDSASLTIVQSAAESSKTVHF